MIRRPTRADFLSDTPLGGIDPFTWTREPTPQPATATPKPTTVTPKPTLAAPKPSSTTASPQPSSTLAIDSTPKTLTPRPIPKANLTPAELAVFLRAIDGSDKTKKLLLVDLYTRFKSAGSQASIKAKLEEVAIKAGAKGSVWTIKPAAWVSKDRLQIEGVANSVSRLKPVSVLQLPRRSSFE